MVGGGGEGNGEDNKILSQEAAVAELWFKSREEKPVCSKNLYENELWTQVRDAQVNPAEGMQPRVVY